MKTKILIAIIVILAIICAIQAKVMNDKNSENRGLNSFIYSLNDTIVHLKRKDGLNAARISIMEVSNYSMLLSLKSTEPIMGKLQKEALYYKDKASQIVYIQTETIVEKQVPTIESSDDNQKPVYSFNFKDDWISLRGQARFDNTDFDLSIKNDYSVAFVQNNNMPHVVVTPMNPYSNVNDIRSFRIPQQKQSRFGIGVTAGYGFLYDYSEKRLPHGFFLGIGLNYNFIKF